MFYDIFTDIAVLIILLYLIFLGLSLFYGSFMSLKYRNQIRQLKSEERFDEIEQVVKSQKSHFSWLVNMRILLSFFTFDDYKTINPENKDIDNESTSLLIGLNSIVTSIFMLFYTSLIIGSNIQTEISLVLILVNSIRVIGIILGLYLFFQNLRMTYQQLKLNRKWIGYVAVLVNIISIAYFGFFSFARIFELLS